MEGDKDKPPESLETRATLLNSVSILSILGGAEMSPMSLGSPELLEISTKFFRTLLTRSSAIESKKETLQNLIQALVDERITPDEFVSELIQGDNSPKPSQLTSILTCALPTLRQSMICGQTILSGILPPAQPPLQENLSVPSTSIASTNKDVQQPTSPGAKLSCDKESGASTRTNGQSVIRDRSASRDSIIEDPRSSFVDSISAISGRPAWGSNKDMADDDPSISSIKGDSVSATIADYNRKHLSAKHRAASSDNQSRVSSHQESQLSTGKNDDSSVNLNYYAASCSSTTTAGPSRARGHNRTNRGHNHTRDHRSRRHSRQKRNNQGQLQQQQEYHHHTRNSSGTSRRSSLLEQTLDIYDLPQATVHQIEPIVIRGNGNMTLFGLSNSFNSEFPPALLGRVSREEFDRTMSHINSVLRNQQSLSAKLLLFGGLFCCCSLGLSLVWPSIVLKRRSKANLEKFLANENQRLYSKLGLNWRLGQRCFNRFVEHIIIIEFNPKIDPFVPD